MASIPKYSKKTETKYAEAGEKAESKNPYFKFVNVNPEGVSIKTGNCVVRAVSLAEEKTYRETEHELLEHLSKIGYGFYAYLSTSYLDEHYKSTTPKITPGCKRMNGKDFAETHPEGRYILKVANHLTTCINGKICDTWDCTRKCVYRYWTVKE